MSGSLDNARAGVSRDSHDTAHDATDSDFEGVERLVPRLDYDALGMRTVIVRVRAYEGMVSTVAAELCGPHATDVYETTGDHNILAICRFGTREALDAVLSRLATDDRVRTVTASVVLRTVCEYDHDDLLTG